MRSDTSRLIAGYCFNSFLGRNTEEEKIILTHSNRDQELSSDSQEWNFSVRIKEFRKTHHKNQDFPLLCPRRKKGENHMFVPFLGKKEERRRLAWLIEISKENHKEQINRNKTRAQYSSKHDFAYPEIRIAELPVLQWVLPLLRSDGRPRHGLPPPPAIYGGETLRSNSRRKLEATAEEKSAGRQRRPRRGCHSSSNWKQRVAISHGTTRGGLSLISPSSYHANSRKWGADARVYFCAPQSTALCCCCCCLTFNKGLCDLISALPPLFHQRRTFPSIFERSLFIFIFLI